MSLSYPRLNVSSTEEVLKKTPMTKCDTKTERNIKFPKTKKRKKKKNNQLTNNINDEEIYISQPPPLQFTITPFRNEFERQTLLKVGLLPEEYITEEERNYEKVRRAFGPIDLGFTERL